MSRYEQHQANAMCDLINFVLKCTGCDLQIDLHDIEDPDNATSKLTDLQDEYHHLKITDYPLISKAKGNASFRATMTGFFHSLISTAHAAGVLYRDAALLENLQVWVTSMSSSAIRPFRHTATVISLAIGTTMCGLAADIADNIAKTMRQRESEQKKKNVNKERVAVLHAKVADEQSKRAAADTILEDIFQTVYVHRYRDVDAKIRVECVTALGTWITTAPEIFFAGQYIRYLGWVLSDTAAPTRAEVIKQLSRLFKNKDNVGRLRAFTERFRPRLVEMATRDAEPGIRAATVELLDMVRETGLLEPDDTDTIGKLIFDTELRVRKAVAGFFYENINDLFEIAVEDLGGEEAIGEYLGDEVEDDYDAPRISWLKFRCLAEVLESYDNGNDESSDLAKHGEVAESLRVGSTESRFSLAAQAIYEGVPEVRDWKVLAGYLLYDHSSLPVDESDPERAFRAGCQPNERQEILLLEILNVAVKSSLTEAVASEVDKKGHKSKVRTDASREIQEMTAIHLAQVIPQLLKKFGSNPATATAVLRLEHVLNLEIFQELRQDTTTYSSLLDDINKQFLTHADQGVLAEASTALLHARSFEDLEEITESKMQELWEDTINTLRALVSGDESDDEHLTNICNTVRRIANLASISDCVALFNTEPRSTSKRAGKNFPAISAHDILLSLIDRHLESDHDLESVEQVNELTISAMRALLFHNMWLARSLHATLASNTPISEVPSREPFAQALRLVMESRKGADPVRLAAAGIYLDLYTLFATFRNIDSPNNDEDIKALVQHISPDVQALITTIFTAAEKQFAKKSHRTLESTTDDSPAIDSEPEDSSSDEDEDDEISGKQNRVRHETLLAEKQLCELSGKIVLAIVGRVLDSEDEGKGELRERLVRNKTRLGPNFKEVVAFLDGPPKARAKATKKAAGNKEKAKSKSEEVVRADDDEIEDTDDERPLEEGGEEDLRKRELDGVGADAPAEDEHAEEVVLADEPDDDDDIMGD